MEQFMKLPPGQKAAVLLAVVALVGIAAYFGLVDPELARGDKAKKDLQKVEKDLAAIRADASVEEQERLRKQKDELTELDKENRKMLPAAEEVPDFVDQVQKDAHNIGMRVLRFDRLPDESYDLHNAFPIRMAVEGTMTELIQFLRVYAGPERRTINVRDLTIERVLPDPQVLKDEVKKHHHDDPAKAGQVAKTPEQVRLDNIEIAEEARRQSMMRATFTAYAYSWTGKPLTKTEGGPPPAAKKKKKRT